MRLAELWLEQSLGDILKFCSDNKLCKISERLTENLNREVRVEEYNEAEHSSDKGNWLAEIFLKLQTNELKPFVDFITDNTPLSRKLAYVCFSRAEKNLRILLFTPDPESAKKERIEYGLFEENQISIAS